MQLLLRQPSDAPVVILIPEGVTQGDPLSMVMCGIKLAPLADKLGDADSTLLSPFYANDVVFDRPVRRSVVQLGLLMDRGPDWGYFPKPPKFLFIAYNPEEKDAAKREFERAGLNFN